MNRYPISLLASLLFLALACEQPRTLAIVDAGSVSDASSDVQTTDVSGPETSSPDGSLPLDSSAGASDACTPDCAGRRCGGDGCGGTCGACAGGSACMAGACVDACPPNSSPSGDECSCDAGYTVGPACSSCVRDLDGDGCPQNAHLQAGRCACDIGFVPDACACVPEPVRMCPAGEADFCGRCIDDADGDGCPANAAPGADGCACTSGYRFDATGCVCEAQPESFTHPAFESDSCTGPLMTFDEAEMRYADDRVLGSYQMVFRQRTCDGDRCTPWEQVSLRDIPWATQASGVARLASISGEMNVDLQTGVCSHHHYLNNSTYIVGSRCSGIGAELVCGGYSYPGRSCRGYREDSDGFPVLGSSLRFFGQLRQSCLQLRADVSRGNIEAQAAVLVTL